jgi:hypothetical protein
MASDSQWVTTCFRSSKIIGSRCSIKLCPSFLSVEHVKVRLNSTKAQVPQNTNNDGIFGRGNIECNTRTTPECIPNDQNSSMRSLSLVKTTKH